MFCNLREEDCAEIYHALGCVHAANLQARIGFDGELLAKGDGHLYRGDALAIYNALIKEREHILDGAYDSYPGEAKQAGSIPRNLVERIDHILAEIGPRGENLNACLRAGQASRR